MGVILIGLRKLGEKDFIPFGDIDVWIYKPAKSKSSTFSVRPLTLFVIRAIRDSSFLDAITSTERFFRLRLGGFSFYVSFLISMGGLKIESSNGVGVVSNGDGVV